MKRVLLYYRYFRSLGGGEFLPICFAAELQKKCKVTLALDWSDGLDRAASKLGLPLDSGNLDVVQLMPIGTCPAQQSMKLSVARSRALKRLAKECDVCISLANPIDFGRPSHHFITNITIGDEDFSNFALGIGRSPLSTRIKNTILNHTLRPLLGMSSKRKLISDQRNRIYPNSRYMADLLRQFYGPFVGDVFYPPTLFRPESPLEAGNRPLDVLYIGRICVEKRIEDIVDIVTRVRGLSGKDVHLVVAGALDATEYVDKLKILASQRKWFRLVGPVYGREKDTFLQSGSFAIHTERVEAFGISVTEYLKAGLIPIVPDEGGSCEIVDNPALTYHTINDAARILLNLISNNDFRESQQRLCADRANIFSQEAYLVRQRKLLSDIVGC